MCPVLAFTPDVESALRWFDATYEFVAAEGRCWYRRVGLPGPGSIGEQDNRLIEALDWLAAVHNDIVRIRRRVTEDDATHG